MEFKIEQINSDETGAMFFKNYIDYAIKCGFGENLLARDVQEYIGANLFVIIDDLYQGKLLVKPTVLHMETDDGKKKKKTVKEKTVYGSAAVIDGVISSVFKDESVACSGDINALKMLMPVLINSGGNKLVCKGELAKRYMAFGFVLVAHAAPGFVNGEHLPEKFYLYKPKENEYPPPDEYERFKTYEEAFEYLKGFMAKKRKLCSPANRSHFLDQIYLAESTL